MVDMERVTFGIGGQALSALVAGPEDGETVVLVHGLLTGAELWRGVADELVETGRHVVAVDLPGHGETLTPARADHSPGGMAELLGTWLRTTAGTAPWVIAHDLGGGVAQIVATRYPTAMSHLTLSGSMVEDTWPVPFVDKLRKRADSSLRRPVSTSRLHRWVARGAGPNGLGADDVARVFEHGTVTDDDVIRSLERQLSALDSTDTVVAAAQLSRLPMPVDLVWGDADPYTPADAVAGRLLELAPQAEMGLVADTGHWAPLEDPAGFVATCLDVRDRDRTVSAEAEPDADAPESA
ncbi:alpha/beta fold hydrolase [Salsipaludibacter albus]|uniref:alpha/beta fold hydrolase n=1 Tax=Salsipaludibacter albus TaxID=2849650 RepID=UPI001EE3EC06|nr:alpha/beta hydrolase [Salsipaludibacter albus]MBY5163097.1 alpha/beta hydrolase [Salsipaludibacter albus]